jgi:molybdopterin-guanine dinucleotide biosynthesis protein A
MGRDKALLPFRGGVLVAAVARQVEQAAGSAILVGRPDLGGIPDLYPGEGPLGGILTALHHTAADWNVIVACDLPCLSAEFLNRLLEQTRKTPAAIVLPYVADGRPEPLCAAYHRSALPVLDAAFHRGIRKVTAAFEGLDVLRVEVMESLVFQNVNTPEEWSPYAAE